MSDADDREIFSTSGGEAKVAFELLKYMRNISDEGRRQQLLDQFAECVEAARGARVVKK